jgi:hypothetical protein
MINLKPCPFCGAEAQEWEASWTALPRVGCRNPVCSTQPSTPADVKKILSIRGWKRAKISTIKKIITKMWNDRKELNGKSRK